LNTTGELPGVKQAPAVGRWLGFGIRPVARRLASVIPLKLGLSVRGLIPRAASGGECWQTSAVSRLTRFIPAVRDLSIQVALALRAHFVRLRAIR
jgi:hypothetical protein